MWHNTKITQLLNIRYPILLGPMGGGYGSTDLLATVSNLGGLGSVGVYTLNPQEILDLDKEIKQKTSRPYNINLWVSDVDKSLANISAEQITGIANTYKQYFNELSVPMPVLSADIPSKFDHQVESIFRIKPAVFSFTFGIPAKEILAE